ncbi:hypothetical protein QTL95_23660 [Rhizobium sp. S152]|uniref:hypothetical protein n=1 Tax=Rhizobium sp. S152 TaxID=3055038 RepID=UPI0025AA1044|nr:hypothetical protein [Rhizobium sp. S152]MDM9628899.1 hypothetical protein [Rhizobium sp. S152]
MTSYRTAYNRIVNGMLTMTEASGNAVDGAAAARCIDEANMFKDELDALTAAQLKTSSKQYQALTAAMKQSKQRLDELSQEIADLVKTAETVAKVVAALAKIITLL